MNRRYYQRRFSSQLSSRHRRTMKRQMHPPVMWNIQGVRGKMSANCLWHACQALCVGLVLFSVGGVMSFLGFQADGVLNNNVTVTDSVHYYEDSRSANIKFSKLSYAGPIVMGVGGFIIVAACVMTFEARDSAAKVGPAAFVKTRSTEELNAYPVLSIKSRGERSRSIDTRSIAVQTLDESSFENLHVNLFDKKNLVETFRKFSRTIRKSTSKDEEMHKSPSAPNLLSNTDSLKSSLPNVSIVGTRRSSCLPKMRNRVPPGLMRQALSIDCSTASPFLATPTTCSTFSSSFQAQPSIASTSSTLGVAKYVKKGMYRTITNTSTVSEAYYNISVGESGECSVSPSSQHSHLTSTFSVDRSSGSGITIKQATPTAGGIMNNSGTVDLHLPNGMVTLNIVHATGASALSGSSTSLRTLSPYPSYQSEDSSFDLGSIKSDTVIIAKSPIVSKPPRFRSESIGRPALTRQSKVDHTEISAIHDSDEDQKRIPEVEHESDTEEEEEEEGEH